MSDILSRLDEWQENIQHLRYQDAIPRLSAFLDWLYSDPLTKEVADRLESILADANLLEGCSRENPPRLATPQHVAAFGLHLMLESRRGRDLWQIVLAYGLRPPRWDRNVQDLVDEALRRYIIPALAYIKNEVERSKSAISAEKLIDGREAVLFTSDFGQTYPRTEQLLRQISNEFSRPQDQGGWQNIGNSSREMLIAFAGEVRSQFPNAVSDDVKAGDFKGIIKHTLSTSYAQGRYRETLEKLTIAAWDHAQPVTHRPATTKFEAQRCFLWSCMVISEIALLLGD